MWGNLRTPSVQLVDASLVKSTEARIAIFSGASFEWRYAKEPKCASYISRCTQRLLQQQKVGYWNPPSTNSVIYAYGHVWSSVEVKLSA
jgi:hypothetical protein